LASIPKKTSSNKIEYKFPFVINISFERPILNVSYLGGSRFEPGEQIEFVGSVGGRFKVEQLKAEIITDFSGSFVLVADTLTIPQYTGTEYQLPPWFLTIPQNALERFYFLRISAENSQGKKSFKIFNISVQ
jgi:hypothetical protein